MSEATTYTGSIEDCIKRELHLKPFPQDKLKGLGLVRSIIPQEQVQFLKFTLDTPSNLQFSSKALGLGITTDELLRRLVWSYISGS